MFIVFFFFSFNWVNPGPKISDATPIIRFQNLNAELVHFCGNRCSWKQAEFAGNYYKLKFVDDIYDIYSIWQRYVKVHLVTQSFVEKIWKKFFWKNKIIHDPLGVKVHYRLIEWKGLMGLADLNLLRYLHDIYARKHVAQKCV